VNFLYDAAGKIHGKFLEYSVRAWVFATVFILLNECFSIPGFLGQYNRGKY
jgi:hypothetical protein